MASTSGRVVNLAGLLVVLSLMVAFFHFYARSSYSQQSLDRPEVSFVRGFVYAIVITFTVLHGGTAKLK